MFPPLHIPFLFLRENKSKPCTFAFAPEGEGHTEGESNLSIKIGNLKKLSAADNDGTACAISTFGLTSETVDGCGNQQSKRLRTTSQTAALFPKRPVKHCCFPMGRPNFTQGSCILVQLWANSGSWFWPRLEIGLVPAMNLCLFQTLPTARHRWPIAHCSFQVAGFSFTKSRSTPFIQIQT